MLIPRLHILLFNKKIQSFHFFGVLGFILGCILGFVLTDILGLDPLITLMMCLAGAATFFVLVIIVKKIMGTETIVYYHHEISIVIVTVLLLYVAGVSILQYLDIAILGIATFLSLGRIGCFSVGCCHGKPSPRGIVYGKEHVEAGFTWYYENVKLFPIQLLESVTVSFAIVAGVLLLMNGVVPGTILIFYTISYGMMRFIFEFFRGDPERPLLLGISEAQWTSLTLASITFILSLVNWLPYYSWHLFVLITMFVVTVFFSVVNTSRNIRLTNTRHKEEIAEGIKALNDATAATNFNNSFLPIEIYTTSQGMVLSRGELIEKESYAEYYTVSLRNSAPVSLRCLKKIGQLIRQINGNDFDFRIIEKQSSVYHIVFTINNDSVYKHEVA